MFNDSDQEDSVSSLKKRDSNKFLDAVTPDSVSFTTNTYESFLRHRHSPMHKRFNQQTINCEARKHILGNAYNLKICFFVLILSVLILFSISFSLINIIN